MTLMFNASVIGFLQTCMDKSEKDIFEKHIINSYIIYNLNLFILLVIVNSEVHVWLVRSGNCCSCSSRYNADKTADAILVKIGASEKDTKR